MTNDEKIDSIRQWLRYHGDYDVQINLHSLYRTIDIRLLKFNTVLTSDHGMDFGKRLDHILNYIENHF